MVGRRKRKTEKKTVELGGEISKFQIPPFQRSDGQTSSSKASVRPPVSLTKTQNSVSPFAFLLSKHSF